MGMLMTFQDSIYQMELCGIQFPPDLGLHFLHLLCVCSLLRTCVQKRWKRTMEFQVSLWYYIHSVVSFDHFSGGHMHCSNISISVTWGDDKFNYSLHSIQKYTQSFIHRHYLLGESNNLQEWSSRKHVNFVKQIMPKDKIIFLHIFNAWILLCLLSFTYSLQHAGSFENQEISLGAVLVRT